MQSVVFKNGQVFDGVSEELREGMHVLVENGRIREISDKPIKTHAVVIDVRGDTLMPGLIDLHIHAYACDVDVKKVDIAGEAYRTGHATRMLGHALSCGFTSVRDIGGGNWSLWKATQDRLITSPRLFYAGKMISMTGGHGGFRQMEEHLHAGGYCTCGGYNSMCVVADGVDSVIRAAREELRLGAHCIKIMASGGVASPTDPIWMDQYREDEVRAIVGECAARRTYAAAHCHPASAIRRCVEFGVRCIEHGTLIDRDTATFVAESGAYVVPTMATIFALKEAGKELGFPVQSQEKMETAYEAALSGLALMREAGVKLGFGTDLLGKLYTQQCREFEIRREVFQPIEILRQCTSIAAEILMQRDQLGCIKVGAAADILVVGGDPTTDISLLAQDGRGLKVIMLGGELHKNAYTT